MRIGIDARMYSSSFTGIGRYVYELTQRLFEIGREHEWVLFMNDPEFERFEPPHAHVKKVRVNARHYSWAEQWRFWHLLRAERLDLMHFTHFNAPLLYRRPSVVTIHDLTLSTFPGKKMRSPLHRAAYHTVLNSVVKRARAIIAVSENTKRDLIELTPARADKISVIYEAVAKEFRPLEGEAGEILIKKTLARYRIEGPFVLYTGVWRDHKNLVGLIEAFAKVRKSEGFDGQLVVTGREDPFYPEVKQAIREQDLEDSVVLTGLVSEEELVALYNAARVYAMPSFYEGFGLPPLEAMACGTPVVCSNAACLPEICGEGNALFFDPLNTDEAAHQIQRAWSDESLRAQLTSRGLRRVTDFSWDRMAKATLSLYNKAHESS